MDARSADARELLQEDPVLGHDDERTVGEGPQDVSRVVRRRDDVAREVRQHVADAELACVPRRHRPVSTEEEARVGVLEPVDDRQVAASCERQRRVGRSAEGDLQVSLSAHQDPVEVLAEGGRVAAGPHDPVLVREGSAPLQLHGPPSGLGGRVRRPSRATARL